MIYSIIYSRFWNVFDDIFHVTWVATHMVLLSFVRLGFLLGSYLLQLTFVELFNHINERLTTAHIRYPVTRFFQLVVYALLYDET